MNMWNNALIILRKTIFGESPVVLSEAKYQEIISAYDQKYQKYTFNHLQDLLQKTLTEYIVRKQNEDPIFLKFKEWCEHETMSAAHIQKGWADYTLKEQNTLSSLGLEPEGAVSFHAIETVPGVIGFIQQNLDDGTWCRVSMDSAYVSGTEALYFSPK